MRRYVRAGTREPVMCWQYVPDSRVRSTAEVRADRLWSRELEGAVCPIRVVRGVTLFINLYQRGKTKDAKAFGVAHVEA
jgi:hypothetical protein